MSFQGLASFEAWVSDSDSGQHVCQQPCSNTNANPLDSLEPNVDVYFILLPCPPPPQTTPTKAATALKSAREELASLTAKFNKANIVTLLSRTGANRPPEVSEALHQVSDCLNRALNPDCRNLSWNKLNLQSSIVVSNRHHRLNARLDLLLESNQPSHAISTEISNFNRERLEFAVF